MKIYDVNKRIGRFMMNGNLLTHGFHVINVPALKKQQFNELMIEFYTTHNHEKMTQFMLGCLDPRIVEIMS